MHTIWLRYQVVKKCGRAVARASSISNNTTMLKFIDKIKKMFTSEPPYKFKDGQAVTPKAATLTKGWKFAETGVPCQNGPKPGEIYHIVAHELFKHGEWFVTLREYSLHRVAESALDPIDYDVETEELEEALKQEEPVEQ